MSYTHTYRCGSTSRCCCQGKKSKKKTSLCLMLRKRLWHTSLRCSPIKTCWQHSAIIVVRNALLETSTVCPSASIDDCDFDAWIPSEFSVSCDDACPDPLDPYACGGWQQITRKVVVPPDSCGLRCPDLARFKKCN